VREKSVERVQRVVRLHGGPKKLSRKIHRSERCVYWWSQGERLPDALALAELGLLGVDLNQLLLGRK
jgi:hypothetical protein